MHLYTKLPTSRSTRVLTLTSNPPHARDEAVYCEWSIISIDHPETYYALSYVWGDAKKKEYDLVCNGRLMKITYNLWVALKAVRSKAPSIRLWVDAICINQEDNQEKNQQVAMMGSIYSRAEWVIVWIGEETETSSDFFRAHGVVKANGKLMMEDCPPPNRPTKGRQAVERAIVDRMLDCGDDIARRPWFERAWTFQEIRLATHAVILCGPYTVNSTDLVKTIHQINMLSISLDLCGARSVDIQMFAPESAFMSLYRLLALTQRRKATDPRDKIFSLLSMLPSDLYGFMKPDYDLSPQQVFAYANRVCLEIDGEINILLGAGIDSTRIETPQEYSHPINRDPDLPSWAVDWGVYNSQVYSNQHLSQTLKITDQNVLHARNERGKQLDPTSMQIRLAGISAGRFVIDRLNGTLTLVEFPPCALKSHLIGNLVYTLLSDVAFQTLWKALLLHDTNGCLCNAARSDQLHSPPRRHRATGDAHSTRSIAYKLSGVPSSIRSGDWLWTPTLPDNNKTNENSSSRDKDEIPWAHYLLRPIHRIGEPHFQLLGQTSLKWLNGDTDIAGGDRARYTDPLVKIQATFVLV